MINPKIKEFLDSSESSNQQIGIILAIGEGVSINEIVDYFIHHSKCWAYKESKFDYWYNASILDLEINVGFMGFTTLGTDCLYVDVDGSTIYGMYNNNGEYYDEHDNYLHSTIFNHINITVRDFISSIKT